MKTKHLTIPALISLFAILIAFTSAGHAQVEGAPAYVDYQGTVFDGTTGAPLGSAGTPGNYTADPTNYTMEFKVYDEQTGGSLIWAETQTVTVALGQFSAPLGLGVASDGISPAPTATSIIKTVDQKSRYLEVTVIIPPAVTGTPITPRLAFQSSPFSLVAERAKLADEVIGKVTATADSTFTGGTFTGGTIGTPSSPATLTGTLTGNVLGNVSGTASNVTGVISIANGGTGSNTKNFVDTTGNQSGILGNKSFSHSIAVGTTAAPTDTIQAFGSTPGIKVSNTAETYSGLTMEDAQATASQYGAIRYDSGSNNLGLFVNSTTPQVVVQSSGNLKFGPTANLNAAGGEEALRIVRGTVTDAGVRNAGSGFTVTRTATGRYDIRFPAGTFSSRPSVTGATYVTQKDNFMSTSTTSTTQVIMECWDNDTQTMQDSWFHFIAIGPR
jgi:hypothetical protein